MAKSLLRCLTLLVCLSVPFHALAETPEPSTPNAGEHQPLADMPPVGTVPSNGERERDAFLWDAYGDLGEGWIVEKIERHWEFLRLHVVRQAETRVIEIAASTSGPGEWSSERHRVQPGPNASVEPELLRQVLARTAALEREGAPSILLPEPPRNSRVTQDIPRRLKPGSDLGNLWPHMLNLLVLIVFLWCLLAWLRLEPRWRFPVLVGSVLVMASIAVTYVWPDLQPDPEHVTVLHEGRSLETIRQVFGINGYEGESFAALTRLVSPELVRLPYIGRMQAVFGVANLVFFFLLAAVTTRSYLASAVASVFLTMSLGFQHAVVSEGSALYQALGFQMAVLAAAVFNRREDLGFWSGVLAPLLFFLVWGGTLLASRPELTLMAFCALTMALWRLAWGDARLAGVGHGLIAVLTRELSRWRGLHLVAGVLLAYALLVILLSSLHLEFPIAPLIFAFYPFGPEVFAVAEAGLYILQPAVVVLALLGLYRGFKRLDATFLFPVSFLLIFKIYYHASQGHILDLFRYMLYLWGAIAVLALLGWVQLGEWARERRWPGTWKPVAYLLVGVLFFAGLEHWSGSLLRQGDYSGREAHLVRSVVHGNVQIEAEAVMDWMRRYPECVMVSKVALLSRGPGDGLPMPDYRYVLFSPVLEPRWNFVSLEEATQSEYAANACLLFYKSLDCNYLYEGDCLREVEGLEVLDEIRFPSRPYNAADEWGSVASPVHLALYRLSPRPGPNN